MKFYVEDGVFEKMPNVIFGLVSVYGVDNSKNYDEIENLLDFAVKSSEEHFKDKRVKEEKEVLPYRDAFVKLNINPNKYMSSIEALLTRISKQKGMPHINAIVNLGNAVSLKHYVPVGAHDLDSMYDNKFCVRIGTSNDTFIPFGETEKEPIDDGEVVYATGTEIRTRRWIWRQSEAGKITESTKNLLFIIDGFEENKEDVLKARDELSDLLEKVFKVNTKKGLIDSSNREFETEL